MGGKSKQTQTTSNPLATQRYNMASSALGNSTYKPLDPSAIGRYMNPYQSQVIGTMNQASDDALGRALNDVDARAAKAGAFGNSGYNIERAMTASEFDKNRQSALANLLYQGFGQSAGMAQQENMAENNFPLAIQALLGNLAQGTESTSTGTMKQPTDWGSIMNTAGSAANLVAMFSDVRLKRDIVPLGTRNGRKWYEYSYLWSDDRHQGVMAHENPDIAFEGPGGYAVVDYGAL